MAKKAAKSKGEPKSAAAQPEPKEAAAPTQKPAAKKAASKPAAKKAAVKKTAAKKAVKKAAAETASAPKPAAKKATKKAAKKTAAKKAAPKKAAKKAVRKTATPEAPVSTPEPGSAIAPKKAASKLEGVKPSASKITASTPVAAKTAVRHIMDRVETGESGRIEPVRRRAAAGSTINGSILYRQAKSSVEESVRPRTDSAAGVLDIPPLPDGYDETRISVLVRDADWIFVYWEISEATRREFELSATGQPLVLRLYDVTGLGNDRSRAHSKVDVPVMDYTNSWYVHVGGTGREFLVELGALGEKGAFRTIVRSNVFTMPTHRLSDDFDWSWGPAEEESHLQLLRMSGGVSVSSHLSSADFVAELQKRLAEQTSSWGGFSAELLGSEFMVRSLSKHDLAAERERGFWLVVDAEVIVYGATEPDAKVRFMGRDIRLNADGTFGVRMALPNGTLEFPVEASSADGEETRSVMPVVTRRTI
ncbi:MAG: uncharacterized protein PWP23_2567 [Candidatus Sumerlaeota bacterium]|nr:uncharacterized protein [Candidatus Sumerlaeota bacterium]